MGKRSDWKCSNEECNTETGLVSGGRDRGFVIETETRVCRPCKLVADYQIGVISDPSHQTFTEEELASHADPEPKCRECGEETVAWDLKCPECDSVMEDGYGDLVNWD